LNGVYSIPRDTFFQFESLGLRGHDCKLFKKRFRLDIKKVNFSNRVVDNWNCLSACCVSSTLSEIVGYIWPLVSCHDIDGTGESESGELVLLNKHQISGGGVGPD